MIKISVDNSPQRTEGWYKARQGMPTASNFSILMAARGLGAAAVSYAKDIIADELMEVFEDNYVSKAMSDGIENEPIAAHKYEVETMNETKEVGFYSAEVDLGSKDIQHIFKAGCSPDRLVGDDGGIEIKCPQKSKHISNLLSEECPKEYYDQIQGCLFITQRKWWDFVSYNPNFKPEYRMKIIRVLPDEDWQNKFKVRAYSFAGLIDELKAKI